MRLVIVEFQLHPCCPPSAAVLNVKRPGFGYRINVKRPGFGYRINVKRPGLGYRNLGGRRIRTLSQSECFPGNLRCLPRLDDCGCICHANPSFQELSKPLHGKQIFRLDSPRLHALLNHLFWVHCCGRPKRSLGARLLCSSLDCWDPALQDVGRKPSPCTSCPAPCALRLAPYCLILTPGSLLLAPGSLLLAPSAWRLAPCSWLLAPGTWLVAPGS